MIIIKLGGTNGSGKTSIARTLITASGAKPYMAGDRREAYTNGSIGGYSIAILGDYEPRCGGLDVVKPAEARDNLVRKFISTAHDIIFFESYITGCSYETFQDISEEMMATDPWLYAFLDTPVKTCIERVAQRQHKLPHLYTPPKTLIAGHRRMQQAAKQAQEAGHPVLWLNHKDRPETLAGALIEKATSLMDIQHAQRRVK